MRNAFLAVLTAGALALGLATPSSAATYVSYLEYWDKKSIKLADEPFGMVTITEMDANTIQVTAELFQPGAKFQKSGKNVPFAFNLEDSPNSTVSLPVPIGSLSYVGEANYKMPAFGTFKNSFTLGGNGFPHAVHPITFNVFNPNGITFAGLGAEYDDDGRLLTTGTGNQFASNAGGWWFAGHIQPVGAASINVAARDAFCISGCGFVAVPEPETWTLMILGFGSAGAALRYRRRRMLAA
jgi:hypothetical protein